jgi:hypothetical protein
MRVGAGQRSSEARGEQRAQRAAGEAGRGGRGSSRRRRTFQWLCSEPMPYVSSSRRPDRRASSDDSRPATTCGTRQAPRDHSLTSTAATSMAKSQHSSSANSFSLRLCSARSERERRATEGTRAPRASAAALTARALAGVICGTDGRRQQRFDRHVKGKRFRPGCSMQLCACAEKRSRERGRRTVSRRQPNLSTASRVARSHRRSTPRS